MAHFMILYRGPLSSCNYGCDYCPFAKRAETPDELGADRAAIQRFTMWVKRQQAKGHEFTIFFTPWGEALIRPWYQDAVAHLTKMPHVRKVAIQTNLSSRLDWISQCERAKLGLWCSYHPSETTRRRFADRCRELDALDVRYSVGVVGLKENLAEAQLLRRELPAHVYLWINAFKRAESYYTPDDLAMLTSIDPLFVINNTNHPSRGRACRAGDSVFSVDGNGVMTRCHFIRTPIGNIYDDEGQWERALKPMPCSNDTCACHIGYVHMHELELYKVFGEGVAERIPTRRIWNVAEAAAAILSPQQDPDVPVHASPRRVRMSLRQVSISG